MTVDTLNTNGSNDERVDAELECMRGHSDDRDRLREIGWSDEDIEDLVAISDSYYAFSRYVAGVVAWHRAE